MAYLLVAVAILVGIVWQTYHLYGMVSKTSITGELRAQVMFGAALLLIVLFPIRWLIAFFIGGENLSFLHDAVYMALSLFISPLFITIGVVAGIWNTMSDLNQSICLFLESASSVVPGNLDASEKLVYGFFHVVWVGFWTFLDNWGEYTNSSGSIGLPGIISLVATVVLLLFYVWCFVLN